MRESVEPVIYKQGQNIIVKGEGLVEKNQYAMLQSLGVLNNGNNTDLNIYVGAALLVIMLVVMEYLMLYLFVPAVTRDKRKLLLHYIVILISLGVSIFLRAANSYLVPMMLSAMLLAGTLGLPAASMANIMSSVLISSLAAGSSDAYTVEMVQLITCTLVSGSFAAAICSGRSGRLRILFAGLAAAASNFTIMFLFGLMTSSTPEARVFDALWCAGGALISSLLCFALQPLLEVIFNLPTTSKLMDLSNPNHPLLKRLLLEAPGTYHHSLVVANLAEASAEAVGANPLLARVGGYYHDVGKLRRPDCFKENQLSAYNKLSEMQPIEAAQLVMSHTRDGAVLAHKYHLPREITRIILEHHGNTPVMFFYTLALKQANGGTVDVEDFRYHANPPSTKEGAIVLLCDTIEAAVRSMQNPTPEAIE